MVYYLYQSNALITAHTVAPVPGRLLTELLRRD